MRFYRNILNPLFGFLNRSEKKRGAWVVALMVLNAALDFFSLASFLPLVFLLVSPDFISSNSYLKAIYDAFDFTSPSLFIISFTGCVLVFTICKNIVTFRITRTKAEYCFATGSELCTRVMARYIEIGYLHFTQLDFTKELNRIANQPIAFANNIIMPLTNLVSEGLVLLTLLFCIAFYNVNVFILLVVVLVPVGLVYLFQRTGLSQTSLELKEKYPRTLKYAFQVVEGLIDIKAFGKEAYFKDRFDEASQSLAKTFSRDHTNQTSAARLTEVIAAFIICSIIIYSVLSSQNYQQTLLLLGVYVGASFRMVSSLNRILNSMLQIKSHEYLFKELEILSHHTVAKSKEDKTPLAFEKTIQLGTISFKYPNGAMALNEASLTIHKGDKIALIGKSGTGKTTLLLILLQFLQEYTGKILVDGVEIRSDHLKAWRKLIGYVPQSPFLLDGTISENIAFGFSAAEVDIVKITQLVHDLDLGEMISQLPAGLSTQIGEKGVKLSGGQRQRIAIARALYAEAEILLLDEITNQLDAQSEQEIVQTLEKVALQHKTILLITHHDHLLKHFDRVLTLDNGVLFETKFSQALN
jgi:ABC-type multidrug transport system fused ATPase/permease subunit